MKDFAKSIKTCNNKVGNGIKEDLIKIDPLAKDVKASATYEAIKKEPWRVYDILGVGDSTLREKAFELIEKKYGIPYEDLYNAWLRKKWEGGNKKTGNSKIGNSFETARAKAQEALKKIEEELKKEKPDIKKYFEIEKSIRQLLSEEADKLRSQASVLKDFSTLIGRQEEKFYK